MPSARLRVIHIAKVTLRGTLLTRNRNHLIKKIGKILSSKPRVLDECKEVDTKLDMRNYYKYKTHALAKMGNSVIRERE